MAQYSMDTHDRNDLSQSSCERRPSSVKLVKLCTHIPLAQLSGSFSNAAFLRVAGTGPVSILVNLLWLCWEHAVDYGWTWRTVNMIGDTVDFVTEPFSFRLYSSTTTLLKCDCNLA